MAETMSVLEDMDMIHHWTDIYPDRCCRCGTKMDRPLSMSKFDRTIKLCDGCNFIDALLYSPNIELGDKEKVKEDFFDATEWIAFAPPYIIKDRLEVIDAKTTE